MEMQMYQVNNPNARKFPTIMINNMEEGWERNEEGENKRLRWLNSVPKDVVDKIFIDYEDIKSIKSNNLPFIEANTKEVTIDHLKRDCVVPVFSKDNELTISHAEFIESVESAVKDIYRGETIFAPSIRTSHVIKGRVPDALHKPVCELLDTDKTIYYERMMFCVEVPSIYEDISGNRLNLTIGGVRAYNKENLNSKRGPQKFSIFIGFKNMVCCNLCITTDGYKDSFKAMDSDGIYKSAMKLFAEYKAKEHLDEMRELQNVFLTEKQFAQFLGKSRLYQYLPQEERKRLPNFLMTDTQIGIVARNFYEDGNFGKNSKDGLSLWNIYNLLTGANKSSYIDNFADRSVNAFDIARGLKKASYEKDNGYHWFLE